jgi:hypothetical protein
MNKIFASISIISLLTFVTTVGAQSPTTSIRDAVQQQVQQELANIKQAVSKKAFVGIITTKTEANITLTNLKNQSRTIIVAPDATIRLTGSKEGTVADLKVNDFSLVMGDVDGQNKMTAKRILVITQSAQDKRQSVFGTVTKTGSTLTFTNTKNETWTARTATSTGITKVVDGKSTKAVAADIKIGSKIVVLGTTGTTANTLTALNLHILP